MMGLVISIYMIAKLNKKRSSIPLMGSAVIVMRSGVQMGSTSFLCFNVLTVAMLVFITLPILIYKVERHLPLLNYRMVSSRPRAKSHNRFCIQLLSIYILE